MLRTRSSIIDRGVCGRRWSSCRRIFGSHRIHFDEAGRLSGGFPALKRGANLGGSPLKRTDVHYRSGAVSVGFSRVSPRIAPCLNMGSLADVEIPLTWIILCFFLE
jgi:hypothetical protein